MKTRVAGIPCIVNVTRYSPEIPGRAFGPPEDCSPDEPEEFEWELLDRKGYRAKWLEAKLTPQEETRIEEGLSKYLRNYYENQDE